MFRHVCSFPIALLILFLSSSNLVGQQKHTPITVDHIENIKKAEEEKNKDNPFQSQIIKDVPQPPTDYERATKAVEEMLSALRSYDASKAYYVSSSKEFKKAISLDDFKNLVRRFAVLNRNRTFQIDEPEFKGNNLIILNGRLISTDGDAMKAVIDLVQEDGEWVILNIQLTQLQNRKKVPKR